ncbi:hypothetical protein ABW19_dt0203004 [Dactylella cylindrospora]|nr:hypothetical protein ABW19_dt0203004 [Dactylella cylindrospora]
MTITRPPTPDISTLSLKVSRGTSYARRDLYEERQTLEAGIGAFATTRIPSGTRLFCEEPLVILPDEAGHLDLHGAVKALPGDKQTLYWNLAASSKPSKNVAWIDALRAASEEDASDIFNTIVEEYELAWSIYETNRFTCWYANGIKMLGIFPMSARLNHSCAPNVFHRYNPFINRLTVHALRDIEPGEELLTSYIDICHPTVVRRQLLKHWGFRCRCTACDSPDDEEDYRRKRLEDLFQKINNREKKRAKNESKWTEKDYERSLAIVVKTIRLLEKEGMEETDTLGVVYILGAKFAVKCGQEEDAVGWAEKLIEIEKKCLGEDSYEYQRAVELLDASRIALEKSS